MEIEFQDQTDYLLVVAPGPWTEETAIHLIDEAKRVATERGQSHILLDLRQWTRPQREMTRFSSGEHLAKVFLSSGIKVAAFASPEAINKFGENVAVNRGAWFRVFGDEQEAIQWLLSE